MQDKVQCGPICIKIPKSKGYPLQNTFAVKKGASKKLQVPVSKYKAKVKELTSRVAKNQC